MSDQTPLIDSFNKAKVAEVAEDEEAVEEAEDEEEADRPREDKVEDKVVAKDR